MATYRDRVSRFWDLTAVLSLLFGIGFFLSAGYTLLDAQRIAWNGAAATGTVIAIEKSRSGRGGTGYAAVYRFLDRNSSPFTARQQMKLPWRTVREGDTVAVLYAPGDPQRSIINSFWGRFGDFPMLLLSLGLIAFGTRKLIRDRKERAS